MNGRVMIGTLLAWSAYTIGWYIGGLLTHRNWTLWEVASRPDLPWIDNG